MIGSKIVAEALNRGHVVTAISRHPENLPAELKGHANLHAAAADVTDTAALAKLFHGQDAIVHSYAPPGDPAPRAAIMKARESGGSVLEAIANYQPADPQAHDAHVQSRIDDQTKGTRSIVAAAKAAGVHRILGVGGAGTLLVNGVRTMDTPQFPKAFEGGAKSTAVVKEELKHAGHDDPSLQWAVLCPPMEIVPGARTGKFRLGLDDLLVAADGSSRISLEDYAMAMVDEVEHPKHTGKRFTIGY
jgi:putative NADH-flavin reductase